MPLHTVRPSVWGRLPPPHPPRAPPRRAVQRDSISSLFSSLDAQFDALEADVRRLDAEANALLQSRGARTREWSSERVDVGPGGVRSFSRSYSRLVVSGPTVAPPAPLSLLSGTTLGLALVIGAWAAVGAKLWRGFGATRFKQSSRLPFAAAWPLLAVGSADFRAEMRAALGAGKEEEKVEGQASEPAPDQAPPPTKAPE